MLRPAPGKCLRDITCFISNRQMDLPDRLPLFVVGHQRQRRFFIHRVQEAGLRGRVEGGRRDPLKAQPPHRLAAHKVQGSQVVNEFPEICHTYEMRYLPQYSNFLQ